MKGGGGMGTKAVMEQYLTRREKSSKMLSMREIEERKDRVRVLHGGRGRKRG